MRGTKVKRMLLRLDVAAVIKEDVDRGVPINTVLRKYELNISRPTLVKLIDAYGTTSASPPWLDPEGAKVQEQPDSWMYQGRFPQGEWVKCSILS